MQNLLGIVSLTALCALFIGAPSWVADGALPSPFEVKQGSIMQLVDLAETDDVKICVDSEVKAGATIRYDGNEDAVAYGDCVMVQARNVAIRAADDMPKGTVVTGVYAID
jgi:hypothetical protein